ncbi:MAG: hypothetical protein IJH71_04800 [Eubacterium sp.]|nr:hypothetical protein [Eubacterium sp.]
MTKNVKKKEKAIEAVKKITDQDELYKIAREAPLDDVRVAASMLIDDQSKLERLASVFKDTPVNLAVIPRLTNMEAVNRIRIYECEREEVRLAAEEVYLEHQREVLAEIVKRVMS